MAKLTRVTGKTFGDTATATGADPQIGQFGSALAGTYNGTTDVATIQGLSAWSNGFIDAVTPSNQYPPLPEMTGALKVLSYQENYILQQGVPEYDSATTYYTNGFCSYGGTIYKSLADNNLNNQPDNSPTYWALYGEGANKDLSNLTATGNTKIVPSQSGNSGKFLATKNNVSGWYNVFEACAPDLSAGVSKSTSGFTADADGWLTAYLKGDCHVSINGELAIEQYVPNYFTRGFVPICNGDVVTTYNSTYIQSITFYPLKGI